jgi:carboxyl-terminal processing protease
MLYLSYHINKWILAGLFIFVSVLNAQHVNAQDDKRQEVKKQQGKVQQEKNKPGANTNIQRLVEEIDGLIHKYGLYKDSLDWEGIYYEINSLRFTETDTDSLRLIINVFTQNFRKAGDKHSFFISAAAAKSSSKREKRAPDPAAHYIGSGIALITVPFCFNDQKSKDIRYANTIREQIRKVDTRNNISAWIIDLRNNIGGNMWPMLAGLNALIEDGTVGYFINPSSKSEQPWPSYNGKLMFPNAKIDGYKVRRRDIKIALLIDSMTASSGEMTAVSFIGLPNVKVLGQPSAGYTTANTTYYLSDGTMFNLATSYIADRNRKPYMEKITPDIFLSSFDDNGVEEAVKIIKEWMRQTGKIE